MEMYRQLLEWRGLPNEVNIHTVENDLEAGAFMRSAIKAMYPPRAQQQPTAAAAESAEAQEAAAAPSADA
jgi:hypothetical protein